MTKLIMMHVPTDTALLAAVGEVAIRHEHLNHMLRMTVKSLAEVSVREALTAMMYEGSGQLRERIRKLARRRLGEGTPLLKLQSLLAECERLTLKRNRLVHGLWAKELDGDAHVQDGFGATIPVPTVEELKSLGSEIEAVAGTLNYARLEGWLKDALEARSL
jgi:hypothetical protein